MKTPLRLVLLGVCLTLLAPSMSSPPPACKADYGFSALDQATVKALISQGSLIVVRQRKDLSLINVTAAQVVNASPEVVWATLTDFEHYPRFMPQTTGEKILEREGNIYRIEQTIEVKIWQLPAVEITYQLINQLEPPNRIRFWHHSGTLEGTYGGWDLVPSGPKQTLIFYTLYSNLTSLGWGLGSIMKSQPDFMAGINVTTAMMVAKAVKGECERRAK
jgi:ribosome-associated toxin RatA of RatAB toxin-antitoxin module